jgi:hypothetical protein
MIAIGSEWMARDGRKMRVDEVIIPVDPDAIPWCKMTVLNPGERMRRTPKCRCRISADNLTSDFCGRFRDIPLSKNPQEPRLGTPKF